MTVKTRRLILYFSSNSSRAFWVKASQLPVTADKRQGRREQEGKGPHTDSALTPLCELAFAPQWQCGSTSDGFLFTF